jgi:cell division septal protein FtsQ
MLTVAAVVVAFVLALSVFFKVEVITVTGADTYSPWAIREASGISEGDNLLTFSHARAGAQIKANLPYVNTVRFGIKLPNTVNIIVEEAEVVYSIKDTNGQWWLMSSSGRIVEQANSGVAANYTQVLGVTLESPAVNLQALAAEAAPTETDASGEFIPVTVTGAQRLHTAMQILKALEANDIVGDAASVDVTRVETSSSGTAAGIR